MWESTRAHAKRPSSSPRLVSSWEVIFARACVLSHTTIPEKNEALLVVCIYFLFLNFLATKSCCVRAARVEGPASGHLSGHRAAKTTGNTRTAGASTDHQSRSQGLSTVRDEYCVREVLRDELNF